MNDDDFQKLKRNWENFFLGQTYQLSEYYGKYPLYENLWLLNEKLPEIPCKSRNPVFSTSVDPLAAVTAEDLQAHAKKLLSDVNIKILVVGNMYKEVSVWQETTMAGNLPACLATGSNKPYGSC